MCKCKVHDTSKPLDDTEMDTDGHSITHNTYWTDTNIHGRKECLHIVLVKKGYYDE